MGRRRKRGKAARKTAAKQVSRPAQTAIDAPKVDVASTSVSTVVAGTTTPPVQQPPAPRRSLLFRSAGAPGWLIIIVALLSIVGTAAIASISMHMAWKLIGVMAILAIVPSIWLVAIEPSPERGKKAVELAVTAVLFGLLTNVIASFVIQEAIDSARPTLSDFFRNQDLNRATGKAISFCLEKYIDQNRSSLSASDANTLGKWQGKIEAKFVELMAGKRGPELHGLEERQLSQFLSKEHYVAMTRDQWRWLFGTIGGSVSPGTESQAIALLDAHLPEAFRHAVARDERASAALNWLTSGESMRKLNSHETMLQRIGEVQQSTRGMTPRSAAYYARRNRDAATRDASKDDAGSDVAALARIDAFDSSTPLEAYGYEVLEAYIRAKVGPTTQPTDPLPPNAILTAARLAKTDPAASELLWLFGGATLDLDDASPDVANAFRSISPSSPAAALSSIRAQDWWLHHDDQSATLAEWNKVLFRDQDNAYASLVPANDLIVSMIAASTLPVRSITPADTLSVLSLCNPPQLIDLADRFSTLTVDESDQAGVLALLRNRQLEASKGSLDEQLLSERLAGAIEKLSDRTRVTEISIVTALHIFEFATRSNRHGAWLRNNGVSTPDAMTPDHTAAAYAALLPKLTGWSDPRATVRQREFDHYVDNLLPYLWDTGPFLGLKEEEVEPVVRLMTAKIDWKTIVEQLFASDAALLGHEQIRLAKARFTFNLIALLRRGKFDDQASRVEECFLANYPAYLFDDRLATLNTPLEGIGECKGFLEKLKTRQNAAKILFGGPGHGSRSEADKAVNANLVSLANAGKAIHGQFIREWMLTTGMQANTFWLDAATIRALLDSHYATPWNERRQAIALLCLTLNEWYRIDYAAAIEMCREVPASIPSPNHPPRHGSVRGGNFDYVFRNLLERTRREASRVGDIAGMYEVLNREAYLFSSGGEPGRASECLLAALAISDAQGWRINSAAIRHQLGLLAAREARFADAIKYLRDSADASASMERWQDAAEALADAAAIALNAEIIDTAFELITASRAMGILHYELLDAYWSDLAIVDYKILRDRSFDGVTHSLEANALRARKPDDLIRNVVRQLGLIRVASDFGDVEAEKKLRTELRTLLAAWGLNCAGLVSELPVVEVPRADLSVYETWLSGWPSDGFF